MPAFNIRALDATCRSRTGFATFGQLISSHPQYRPTIDLYRQVDRNVYRRDTEMETLANAYDAVMAALGDPRRAYRMDGRHPDSTTLS